MVRYSILIPAYQAENTIERCLNSVLSQKGDYEVIVIDDGSSDNIDNVIKPYLSKITYIKNKKNKGVAATRNLLMEKSIGEYFLFVDSDDYLKDGLLETVDKVIDQNKDIDVVSFCMETVTLDNKLITKIEKPELPCVTGEELLCHFVENKVTFDTPVGYIYKTEYMKKNEFTYSLGHNHEDFGLTPLVLLYARRIVSLNQSFYCYVQTNESITRSSDQEKLKKNAYDMLYHFDKMKMEVDNNHSVSDKARRYFNSFLANSVILKENTLLDEDKKQYHKELKKRKVGSMLLSDTWKRKVKKILLSMEY